MVREGAGHKERRRPREEVEVEVEVVEVEVVELVVEVVVEVVEGISRCQIGGKRIRSISRGAREGEECQ